MKQLKLLLLFFASMHLSLGIRILGVFPHPGKSHHIVFDVLMKGLAAKGHEVTIISYFPTKNPPKNLKDIDLRGPLNELDTIFKIEDFTYSPWTEKIMRPIITSKLVTELGTMSCKAFLENKEIHKIKQGDFDLVIVEQFSTDCGLGLVHKLKVPFIGICSHVLMPYSTERLGLIENPAYVASHQVGFPALGNLFQCIEGLLVNAYYKYMYKHYCQAHDHALMKKHYGEDLPDLETIAKNMSLLLGSTYFVVNGAHPKPPNYIEIGGLYLENRKVQKLPEDLQKFLDESDEGFILFCMGSMIKAKSWPEDKLRAFKEAFRELPQRVIWKWENETMEGVPENVKIMKWIPQYDILNHKKIKAFITHGGMMGMSEATYIGIPVLTLPLYSDQPHNGARAVEKGVGVLMDIGNITKESLLWGIREVMSPKYAENAKKLSKLYRDRPMSSMDTAIYWVEHVARYGGEHLRSPTTDLPLTRYLLLDVIGVMILIALVTAYIAFALVKCCLKSVFKSKSATVKPTKRSKKD